MQTEYLRTLQVIGEVGSFSRAASELSVTQSAISQRIKFLEEFYGRQLVDRSGKVLVLTEAGRIVSRWAEQILLMETKLANELKQHEDKGRLAICCTPTFGVAFLPKVVERFTARGADNIDLNFVCHSYDRALKELQENEFDLAVIEHCDELNIPGFELVELPMDELIFISGEALQLEETELEMTTLLSHCLITRKPGCTSRTLLELNLSRQGHQFKDFKRLIVLDDLRLSVETVVGGGGVAFVSRSVVANELKAGLLREHRVPGFDQLRWRSAIVRLERRQDPAISGFMDCLQTMFPRVPCSA